MVSRLDALLGQEAAVHHLERLLASGRRPHALLFRGPPSVGKHTAARLLAQALLCPHAAGAAGCGRCRGCAAIQGGEVHPDLTDLGDEDPKLKIEAIREAVRQLHSGAVSGGLRVLVIPDAERMNSAAQNALLKTLEEPPAGAALILTSARPQLLLGTVLSRCQQLRFSALPIEVVAAQVAERRGLPPAQAQLAATLTGGALGPALSLELEPLIAAREQIERWDQALRPSEDPALAAQAMAIAGELAEDRDQMSLQLQLWQSWLRDQLVLATGAQVPLSHADREPALAAAADRGLDELLRRSEALAEAATSLDAPFNYQARLIADTLCLRLAAL